MCFPDVSGFKKPKTDSIKSVAPDLDDVKDAVTGSNPLVSINPIPQVKGAISGVIDSHKPFIGYGGDLGPGENVIDQIDDLWEGAEGDPDKPFLNPKSPIVNAMDDATPLLPLTPNPVMDIGDPGDPSDPNPSNWMNSGMLSGLSTKRRPKPKRFGMQSTILTGGSGIYSNTA